MSTDYDIGNVVAIEEAARNAVCAARAVLEERERALKEIWRVAGITAGAELEPALRRVTEQSLERLRAQGLLPLLALALLPACAGAHEPASLEQASQRHDGPPVELLFFPANQGEWHGDQAGQVFVRVSESAAGVRYVHHDGINLNFERSFPRASCKLGATSAVCAGELLKCPATASIGAPAGYTQWADESPIGIGEPPDYEPAQAVHVFAVTELRWAPADDDRLMLYCMYGGPDVTVWMVERD